MASREASTTALCDELIEAAKAADHKKLEELLVLEGVDVNYKDKKNNTALYYACFMGHLATVGKLLNHGADMEIECGEAKNKQTALMTAIKFKSLSAAHLLLQKGANIDYMNSNMETPMEEAIFSGAEFLVALLEHGAKVNFKDQFGSTPLHMAAKIGRLECIELLLKHGANVDAKDAENMTALDIATAKGHTDVVNLLSNPEAVNECSQGINISQISQSLSQEDAEEPVNKSVILYHDTATIPLHSQEGTHSLSSFNLSTLDSSQLSQYSQYSQQSQMGSQDLNPLHPPRYVRPNFEIDSADVELKEEIGCGFYGKVYKALWQHGTKVAVKQLTTPDGKVGELTRKNFRLEMEMLMALRHPNIVLFLGVTIQSPNLHLIMEYMPRGSLATVLHNGKTSMGLYGRVRMALDVACGMNYLHRQVPEPILHRDLKSSNLLVTEEFRVKVSDFGLARVKDGSFKARNPLDITIQAPEVIRAKPPKAIAYTEKCDIYSYGLLLWELVSVKRPFEGMEPKQIAVEVANKYRPPIPDSCPEPLRELMVQCWDDDPQVRPSFQEIVKKLSADISKFAEKPKSDARK